MDTMFRSHWAILSFGMVWLGIIAGSADASANPDFSQVSDVDLLFHEDKEGAMEEYKRRTREYTPQQIREIEAEFFRQVRLPREAIEPTVDELLAKINLSDKVQLRMKSFTALHERYEAAGTSEKEDIREAFLAAWAEVPYPATYEDDDNNNMSRYRNYAHQAGLYFTSEEKLLTILEERCLNINATDRHILFIDSLTNAKIPLGALTAERMEKFYHELTAQNGNRFINDTEYTTLGQLHHVLGRCGKPGYDALLRMGTEAHEYGIFALQINNAPEAENLLWEMYTKEPVKQNRNRLRLLRAISSKGGTPEILAARCTRVRPELVRYLQLPEGAASIWDIQSAVDLAKDTQDSYYLPHVEALERAFFRLGPGAYVCPGMEDRMDEALATLQESFDKAKLALDDTAIAVLE